VSKVAAARHSNYSTIEPLAQGRVWLGSQAKANGLVDELGGLDTAIELAKKKAKIPETEKVTIVQYPPRHSIFDVLMKRSQDEDMLISKVSKALGNVPMRAWMRGGFLRMMPVWFEVR